MKNLSSTIVYLGLGFLVYMLIYSPDVFTWGDPWLYIIATLWPFILIWEVIVILFWIAVAIGVVVAGLFLYEKYFK